MTCDVWSFVIFYLSFLGTQHWMKIQGKNVFWLNKENFTNNKQNHSLSLTLTKGLLLPKPNLTRDSQLQFESVVCLAHYTLFIHSNHLLVPRFLLRVMLYSLKKYVAI